MHVTRQNVADKLGAYLHHEVSLEELVDWAERQIMDADFESEKVRDVAARLGVAEVRAFGLTWDECQRLLNELGYAAQVYIKTV